MRNFWFKLTQVILLTGTTLILTACPDRPNENREDAAVLASREAYNGCASRMRRMYGYGSEVYCGDIQVNGICSLNQFLSGYCGYYGQSVGQIDPYNTNPNDPYYKRAVSQYFTHYLKYYPEAYRYMAEQWNYYGRY